MRKNKKFTLKKSAASVLFSLLAGNAGAVDFNTDVLDSVDKENIDFSRFSHSGYVMPGQYQLQLQLNDQGIGASSFLVDIYEAENSDVSDKNYLPRVCITPEIVGIMGLTAKSLKKVSYWHNGQCADFSQLSGVQIRPDIAQGYLYINMPQAWLEYSDASWLPPSRWDDGIPGVLFDYNINANATKSHQAQEMQSVGYNGTLGANYGAWRLRADYQGSYNHAAGAEQKNQSQFDWNRFYMYRAISAWRANLTLGENNINSDIFSTWRYTGLGLSSDDRMLPPKLRGYAPQISGIADTNARVVVSQQGRIVYDSTVPAGPFTIQDLDGSLRGRLDVEIIEQNGQKKTFQVDTAFVPYLTRPGQVRFKLMSGRSLTYGHHTEGPVFVSGEASWGISNSWSLYGGSIVAGDYNSLAIGLGRDMFQLGTISSDVTQSVANIPGEDIKQGKSWRVSYSKRFEDANADITFAGYRFSERNYMTMQQYLDGRYRNDFTGQEKESYTATLNKNFADMQTSVGLQYSHQTYWNRKTSDYYTLSVNRYFDIDNFKNVSIGLTASRSQYQGRDNDSVFLRLSIPLGTGTVSYSGSMNNERYSQQVGYSDTLNKGLDNYSINAGLNSGGGRSTQSQFSGYYTHNSPVANLSGNASFVDKGYISFGLTATGGMTITAEGAALHAGGMNGDTRLMVDTDGIGNVPIDGGRVLTNRWGIGVVTDVSSYYRNSTSVDLNKLPDDMEATRSVVESVLTEGAIGYREFKVLKGVRLFAVVRLLDGSFPPFGASVTNAKGRELGMMADSGLVWLTGVTPGETLNIGWDGRVQCSVGIPDAPTPEKQLLLPCNKRMN